MVIIRHKERSNNVMERIWTTCLALLLILGFFVGDSRSQNLIVDQQKQQQQIERLRSDVDELKRNRGKFEKGNSQTIYRGR